MMKNVTPQKIKFSVQEIDNLWKSWLAISAAFAIAMSHGIFNSVFFINLIISTITVGLGFIAHELSHKFVAQKFRCFAEYRANFNMLFLAIGLSFFGIVFAAPGAVMIHGHISRKQYGLIALAGPLANIAIALIFLVVALFNVPILSMAAYYE